MKTNVVYIIESNAAGNGVEAIKNARTSGYDTHFLTRDRARYEAFQENPVQLADHVTEMDTLNIPLLLYFFRDKQPAAILTFDDFRMLPAVIVSNELGLVTPKVSSVMHVRYKDLAREKVNGYLEGQVPFQRLSLEDDITPQHIQFPCVVKPVDESGSVAVKVCQTMSELKEGIFAIRAMSQ
ncbi:MAG: hypothetical protein ACRC5C_13010, partial [Bacilli bacterium]